MSPDPDSLIERRVVQWSLGYLVAAWGGLEAFGFLAELFGWGEAVVRSAAILLGAGLLCVVILSWFHGSQGRQRVTRLEAGLLSLVGVGGILGALLLGPMAPRTPGGDAVDVHEVSLAVLPPTDLSGTPDQEHFVAGMHEALVSQLGQVSALRVISRTSTLKYRNTEQSLPEIARELAVDEVVEASLLRAGDSVRMDVRLVQAQPEERLLWSETFTSDVGEVYSMHGAAARAIAREVRVDVTPDQQSRLASARSVDPETYEAYLRGMHYLGRGRPQDLQQGLAHLHEAVDRNPGDALAYAGLAIGYTTIAHGPTAPPDAWLRAREAALRAIKLDPNLAEAHAALADVKLYYEWDWVGAEEAFRIANELNPSLAMNRYHYAWYLALVERMDEAIVQHRLAKALDPLTPLHTAWLGELYAMDGRPEDGLEEALEALELDPESVAGLMVLGRVYVELERYDDAVEAHRKLAEIAPPTVWMLGETYAHAGREEEARGIRDRLASQEPTPFTAVGLFTINTLLGEHDRALGWLSYEPHHAWLPWMTVYPWVDPLRDDPRFQAFLRRLDLPDARPRVAGL